jgi:hypothetical protein
MASRPLVVAVDDEVVPEPASPAAPAAVAEEVVVAADRVPREAIAATDRPGTRTRRIEAAAIGEPARAAVAKVAAAEAAEEAVEVEVRAHLCGLVCHSPMPMSHRRRACCDAGPGSGSGSDSGGVKRSREEADGKEAKSPRSRSARHRMHHTPSHLA